MTVTITLDRPEKRNALNKELLRKLKKQLQEARNSRVLVLRGEGKVFSAGLDLTELDESEESPRLLFDVFELIDSHPGVTIALVQGAAIAGGAGLIAACDLVFAETKALIGFPEVKRGLVPAQVLHFLKRQLQDRDLRELVLVGELITAARAEAMGLITKAVPDLDLQLDITLDLLLQGAPGAIAETKKLLRSNFTLDEAFAAHKKMRLSAEAKEGAEAFFEKRSPKWAS